MEGAEAANEFCYPNGANDARLNPVGSTAEVARTSPMMAMKGAIILLISRAVVTVSDPVMI